MEAKQIHLKDGKKEYFISIDNVLFVQAGTIATYISPNTLYIKP